MAFYIFFLTILNPTNFGSGCKIMFLDFCRITFFNPVPFFSFLFQLWNFFFRAAGADIVIGTSFFVSTLSLSSRVVWLFFFFFLFIFVLAINQYFSVHTKAEKDSCKITSIRVRGKRKAKFVVFHTLYFNQQVR